MNEKPAAKKANWARHVLLLLGGGLFGACLALGLQLMWQLPCNDILTVGERATCDAFTFSLLPLLFGALFGAIAADLIYTRRR